MKRRTPRELYVYDVMFDKKARSRCIVLYAGMTRLRENKTPPPLADPRRRNPVTTPIREPPSTPWNCKYGVKLVLNLQWGPHRPLPQEMNVWHTIHTLTPILKAYLRCYTTWWVQNFANFSGNGFGKKGIFDWIDIWIFFSKFDFAKLLQKEKALSKICGYTVMFRPI